MADAAADNVEEVKKVQPAAEQPNLEVAAADRTIIPVVTTKADERLLAGTTAEVTTDPNVKPVVGAIAGNALVGSTEAVTNAMLGNVTIGDGKPKESKGFFSAAIGNIKSLFQGDRELSVGTNSRGVLKEYPLIGDETQNPNDDPGKKSRIMSVTAELNGQPIESKFERDKDGNLTKLVLWNKTTWTKDANGLWKGVDKDGNLVGADGKPIQINGQNVLGDKASYNSQGQLVIGDTVYKDIVNKVALVEGDVQNIGSSRGAFMFLDRANNTVTQLDTRTGIIKTDNVRLKETSQLPGRAPEFEVISTVEAKNGEVTYVTRQNGEKFQVTRAEDGSLQSLNFTDKQGKQVEWSKTGPNQWNLDGKIVTGSVDVTGDGTVIINDTVNNERTTIGIDGKSEVRKIVGDTGEEQVGYSVQTNDKGQVERVVYQDRIYTANDGLKFNEQGNPYIDVPSPPGEANFAGDTSRVTFILKDDQASGLKAGTRIETNPKGTNVFDNGGRLMYRYAAGEQPGPNTQPKEAYKYVQQTDGSYKVVEFNNGSGKFILTDQRRGNLDVWQGPDGKEIVGNISVMNDGSLKTERLGANGLETVYQTTMGTSIVTDSSGKREVQDARTNPPTVLVTETPTDKGTVIKIRDGAPPNGATYNYEKPSDQYPQGRFTYTDAAGKEVTANGKVEIFADGTVRIENLDNFSTTRIEPTGESKTKFNRTGATVERDRAGNVTETNDGKGNIRKYQYEIDEKTKQAKVTRVQEGDPMNGGQVWQLQPDGTWKSSRGDSFSGTMTVDRESGNRIVEDRTSKVMITESIADGTVKRENLENSSSQVLQGDKVQVSKDNRGQETQYYHGPDGRIDAVKLPDGRVIIREGAPLNEIQSRDERFKSPTSLETAADISLTDSKLVVTNGTKLVETDLKTGSSFTYDTTPKDDGRPGRKLIEANIAVGGLDQPVQHLKFTVDPSDPTKFVGQIDGKTWTGKFENGSLRLSNLELKQDRVYRPDGSYDITELGKEQRSYDTMNRLSGVLDLNTRIVKTLEYKGNDTVPSTVRILDANKNTETVWRRGNEGVVKDGVKVYQWKNMATDQTFEGPVTIENGKLTFLSDTSRVITQNGDKTTTIHPDGTTYVVGPNGVESWKSPNGQEIIFKTDSGMAGTVIGAITKVVHDGRTYTLNGTAKVDASGRLTYEATDDKECKVVKFTHNLDGTVEGKTPTGELIFAKGPGVNAAAVVGETLVGSKVEKIEPDTVSGGYKATLADGTIAYLRKDGSVIFEKQIGGATQTTERYEKTIISADGTKTIKYTTTVPRRMENAPFGMVYDVPDSYTETIRRKGGEDTVEWKRQADGTWLSSTGEKFNGVHGFLSTGELLKKESIPADPAKGQDALDKYTLNEHSGGIKDIYFTPDGSFKYGVFYDKFRRPAMITNPSERTTFTYDAAGEVKTLTVVNTQTNKSVTYTRGDDGRFRSADNPDGVKIQVNAATGMVTWSDYDGKKSVQSLADGSQVLEDGTRIEQSPNPEVKTRITKIDDKGNIIKTAGSIEVRNDGNVIYRDGTGKEYTYNPDSGNVFVTAPGAELIRFNGKITVDGKGNASIFNEETDRLTVVNVNGTLPQVLERQISQTYADGSSVTAIGGNKLVYKAPDGREITIDGRMDMVNDRPVIKLTNPADYEKVKAFLEPKEGGSCPAEIKLANGAVVRPSLMKMNTLEYRYQGQIVEIPGTLTSDGKIQISDTSKVDPAILAAIANPESGLPIARRVALSNGATIEPDFSTPGRLIYTRNGVSTYINGTINQDTGKLDYSLTGLDENIKTALQTSSQTSELYWSKKGGVSESSYVSKDVILNVNPGSYNQVDGKITIPTGNGSIEYDASKPNKVVVNGTEYDGTVRIDNQGNLKVVLSTPSGKLDLSKIQTDSIKVVSTGDPPSKVDLASIGAPIVQQTRIQSSMESGTLTGYKPAPPVPELKGPGPVSLSSVSLLPASTDTKTDKVVVDPKAATTPSVDPALSLSRLMTGQPDKVYTGADLAAAQARTQQAVVQQTAVELRNTIERSMIANNLSEADRAVVRSALDSGDIPAAMAKLAGTPAGNVLADVDRAIKAVSSVFPPDTNPTKLAVAAVDNLNFTEALNRGRALSNNVTAYNQALQQYQATGDPAVLKGFVPDSTIAAIKAASVSLPKEMRDAAIANNLVTADIRSGRGSDLPSETAIVKTESLRSSGFLTVSERSEGPKVNELAASIEKKQEDLRVAAAYFEREVTRVQALPASEEQKRTLADLQVKLATVQQERVQALAAEMKLTIPAAIKEALGAEANTEAGKKYIEAVKAALNNPTSELAVKLVAAVIAMRREEILQREAAVLREASNPGQVVNGVITPGSLATDRITVIPREVSATIRDVVTQTVEQLNLQARIPGAPPIDAVRAAELVRGIESNLLQAIRVAALNRSALDFLPSFQLTGDLSAFVKDTGAKPFTSPITTMPIDLNVKFGSLTGRGNTNIITADGTMISIERALANPTLLAHLLATNQISINNLNGLLASADLVRILNLAVAGGLTYTQLTNLSNPELAKYFGTTADGVKMGFNVQVGYASGLVYTSQNGVLVPARINSLEDGIFIQSLQGQKIITEAIKSNSGFVTISNGKNRGDEDEDDDEDEEEVIVSAGSKEDFGGKIPTAQPVTQTQTAASQDPTAVLASNQPVPLPDFLILPDGSMEPMPAEWKTKANHEHGHVDVIDENGKHVHVIDAKGNVLTEQQIEKAKQDVAAAKAAEAKAASTDFSPTAPEASLNVPLEIADFVANFGIENQGQAAYIDNDVKQTADANDPLSYINDLPIDSKTGFPYDPSTGYILNPTTGDIIGNINDQPASIAVTANPFEGRLVDPLTGFPYDPSTGILYDPLSGNPVGSVTPEADPIIDLSNDIAMIQDNVETRLDDISAYSHVQDALNDAQGVDDIHPEVASDLAARPEGMDFGTDEEYKEKEKERIDNILNQLEEEEKRLEEQEDELRKRRDEIERLTKLMNSLLATRRQAELDRIRRLIEQQRKIEEFIAKDIRRIKYTVRKGDTLENIAKKHFRDPRLARLIYEMNPAKIKLSQEEGKTAYQLTINSVLTLPSPRQAREWISRGKYLTAVDNSYVAQTELTADDLANMEKRRLNVESVLGALGMAADTNYKPTYTVRFGDSLRSIAMKHPALNDVSLWRLLAKVNDMSIETDAMGTPKATLERGTNLNLPSKEEIAQFRKDNGALVHPSSLKQGASGPVDLVTNVTVFKECPSCKENTPSGVSLCHCCGFVFQETANGVGPETKISTVSKQVTLTNIGGASTEHDPLAPKQDKEDNVHTLNLPESERKVANSDVSPLPKTEVDPKGVPNVSPAAKADITLKLNDPLAPRVDTGITNTGANSDAFLSSMSSMQKSRKDSFSIPSHKYNMSKLVENLSDTSRIVLLDSELDSNNQKAERWQLEVLKDEEWTPVVAYEIIGDNSIRHEYNVTGKARKSIKMNLPSAAVEEMVRNDLSRNWQEYCQKFLTGKKLSQ
ncbi:MAG: LysM peptidoglycan-binding domain-containing protein [Candidatus Melainabacteria bacterium]|nr:LysM peptidoglycan-binding domain-containing protein [Candidatus Melainabacteria bacterium]